MSCVQNPIQTILGTECIGDSLPKINTNFSVLGDNVCQLLTAVDSFNVVDSPTVDLTFDSYTRTLSADVKDLSINTIKLSSASVTNAKIAFDGGSFCFRNKIINGNFDIWQRGTFLSSGTSARFLADRFWNNSIGSTYTVSQQQFTNGQTDVPNNPNYFHRTVVSSVAGTGNFCVLRQSIESVKTLAGQTATLSFYAKADSNKIVSVEFIQYFGTGGSPSSNVREIGVQKLNLTTSWQKFTVTANIPSIAGKTIGTDNNDYLAVAFWFDAGSDFDSLTDSLGQQSGTFDIAQVQLEEGPTATPFEHRPIGTELSLCERYYEKSYNLTTVPGTVEPLGGSPLTGVGGPVQVTTSNRAGDQNQVPGPRWRTRKRTFPACEVYAVNGTKNFISDLDGFSHPSVGQMYIQDASTTGARLVQCLDANQLRLELGRSYCYHYTADAEL